MSTWSASCSPRCASSAPRRCSPESAPSCRGRTNRPPAIPGYIPVWGEVQEDHIQIRPRRRFFPVDILDVIGPAVQIDPKTIAELIDVDLLPVPIPEPDPIGPVALNPQPLPPSPVPTRFRSPWSA